MSRFDDIVFEKRNKKYGAYFLRKRYGWHLLISVVISCILFAAGIIFSQYEVFVKTNITYQILNDSTGIFEFTNFDLADIPVEPQKNPQVDKGSDNSNIEVAKNATQNENTGAEEAQTEEAIEKMMNQLQQNVQENITENIENTIDADNASNASADFRGAITFTETELRKYIYQNTKYPDSALNNKIGGMVMVQFVLTSKGEIKNISIIKNSYPVLDREAMRVVKAIPPRKPVIIKGKPVAVMYRIPIVFKS